MTPVKAIIAAGMVSGLSLLLASCGSENSDDGQSQSSTQTAAAEDTTAPADTAASPPPAENTGTLPAAEEEAATDTAIALADFTGDAAKGKRVFIKCMACHGVDEGQHKIGPSLYGVIDSPAGAAEEFKYSPVMADSDVVWTDETLFMYLGDPASFMPGNRMIFPGLPSGQDRADVIAYLKSLPE